VKKIGNKRWSIGLIAFLINLICLPSAFAVEAIESDDTVGNYIYWDDGISLTGPARLIALKIGGKINCDTYAGK